MWNFIYFNAKNLANYFEDFDNDSNISDFYPKFILPG